MEVAKNAKAKAKEVAENAANKIANARAQFKEEKESDNVSKESTIIETPEPEKKEDLAAKYAAMSLEERAFAILVDLGMVELTPDPDDPTYDSSMDDEIWSGQTHIN